MYPFLVHPPLDPVLDLEFPGSSARGNLLVVWDPDSPPDEEPIDNPRIPPTDVEFLEGEEPRVGAPRMRIRHSAYLAIVEHLGSVVPEAGGMLLGPKGTSLVTEYVPDVNGKAGAASFTLDAPGLNQVLKKALARGLDCKGLAHSHPTGCVNPSSGDLTYVRRSFANARNKDVSEFLLPIFCDGKLLPYIIFLDEPCIVQLGKLELE